MAVFVGFNLYHADRLREERSGHVDERDQPKSNDSRWTGRALGTVSSQCVKPLRSAGYSLRLCLLIARRRRLLSSQLSPHRVWK